MLKNIEFFDILGAKYYVIYSYLFLYYQVGV